MQQTNGSLRNTVLLTVFLLLLLLSAVLAVFSEPLYERQRAAAVEQALAILDGGATALDVNASAYPVHGEEDALPSLTATAAELGGAAAVEEPQVEEGRVALRLYGTLSIPAIRLQLPLYRGAGTTALRFGAGAVTVGETTALFGYRTRVDGRLFHDIDRLTVGDGVTLTRADRVRSAYTVAAVRLVLPDALASELAGPPAPASIALVSNHPAGETGFRIVVWLSPV